MIAIINNGAVLAFANTAVLVGNQIDADVGIFGGLNPANVQLISGLTVPADFAPGIYTYANGALARGNDSPAVMAAAQTVTVNTVTELAQGALTKLISGYPQLEVSTWPQQYTEAQAYTASSTALTPTLSSIATASGQTVAIIAANVMTKAVAYQAASGAIVGNRIALHEQINATTSIPQLNAINLNSGWPA